MEGLCEAKASLNCTGRAQHTHHRKLRKQGGDDRPENLLRCCLRCHQYIHANPELSYQKGWLVHFWQEP